MDDFCQYNLFREPRPPLFIAPPYVRTAETKGEREQTPILHLRVTDPSRILLLCESLKNRCTLDLEAKINRYLMEEGDCDCAFIVSFELIPKSAVVKVMGTTSLESEIILSCTEPILNALSQSKQPFDVSLSQIPIEFQQQLKSLKPNITGEVSIHPVYEQKHENGITEETSHLCIGVFIVNSTMQVAFLKYLVEECFRFVLPVYRNTAAFEREAQINISMHELVTMTMSFFNTSAKDELCELVSDKARIMFQSERCDLYFYNKHRNFEGKITCDGKEIVDIQPGKQGLLGFVCAEKRVVNISDPQNNPMFASSQDKKCEFVTRNILAFPLTPNFHSSDNPLGCMQLRNKIGGDYNVIDEGMAALFSSMSALAFNNLETQIQLRDTRSRDDIANKLVRFECIIRKAEIEHLINAKRHKLDGFDVPTFNARSVPKHRIGVVLMTMFENLELIQTYQLEPRVLAKFLVTIEKGYFDHPYHNFEHAFSAAHFIYATVIYLKLIEIKVLTALDLMALLIAAVCHNVDHRGITNAFRTMGDSTFASLYASSRSVMESHHFAQTVSVLHTEGCNFLTTLSSEDYSYCLELIKHNIMATDYVDHRKHYKTQEAILSRGFRPRHASHKLLLCSLLMTCADFADQLRDWRTVRNVVAGMYQEYFTEDELIKALQKEPSKLEERSRDTIPNLQIDFLQDIVLPPYKVLAQMYPDMNFCIDNLYETINNWEMSKPHFINRNIDETPSLEMLLDGTLSLTNLEACEEKHDEEEDSYDDYL